MRSPVSRVAASVIFVLAVTGVAFLFQVGGATPALAVFLEPILEAKTVKYKMTTEMKGMSKGTATTEVMQLNASQSRSEVVVEMPDNSRYKTVQIWDGTQAKSLHLNPKEKRATLYDYVNRPEDERPTQEPFAGYRSILLDARSKPQVKRESLGERVIDGCRVVGFRIKDPGAVMDVWGDPKTGLPVRIESTVTMMADAKLTMSDFEFNVDLDESLFSVEPPAGYEVTVIQDHASDGSASTEEDLVEMFREYSRWCAGLFPDLIDFEWVTGTFRRQEWLDRSLDQTQEQRHQEFSDSDSKLQRGVAFALRLPKESDAHYAGKGVRLGTVDTPIFWYRPKGSEKYRVIYADLTVRVVETPPSMPVTPSMPPEQGLIELLRSFSGLSDGRFPNSLDQLSFLGVFTAQHYSLVYPKKSQEVRAKEERQETVVKLQRGLRFLALLPEQADSHYAGQGLRLGKADTPIFWYRPKDSETYRVIYADLSVRDAESAPNELVVLPEQDLIILFRDYCEVSGGPLPVMLDSESLNQMIIIKKVEFETPDDGPKPSMEESQQRLLAQMMPEIMKYLTRFQPGLDFANSLAPSADARYAGQGVSLGTADTPIFWYRPKGSETYRVIYADLSVRDADTAPSVPRQPEQDLIDMLRHCCELSGGPFPESLDDEALYTEKAFGLEKGQMPGPKQVKEILKVQMELLPGSKFVASLLPEADAHYAGKGVSLGAADTPIFWYRPSGAEKYRVIYADLSVREAEMPPSVPDAELVPAPVRPNR